MEPISTSSKLILGTVQLGMAYGINNSMGMPTTSQALAILEEARKNGITTLDTAEAYGNSIDIISKFHESNHPFKISTKFSYHPSIDVETKVRSQLMNLKVGKIDTLFFHKFNDFIDYPSIANKLVKIKEEGLIGHLGVSIYTNNELEICLQNEHIDVIQLPFNLLDNFSLRGQALKKAKQSNKEIHARSAFLQGLFYMDNGLPPKLTPLKKYVEQLKQIAQTHHYTIGELALNYVVSQTAIDHILIGVDSVEQLLQNIASLQKGISKEIIAEIDAIQVAEIALLNPVNWN